VGGLPVSPSPVTAPGTTPPEGIAYVPTSLRPETNILAEKPADPVVDQAAAPAEPAVDGKPADVVPVEYKDLKVPEGIQADSPTLTAFTETAGKLGISQSAAEALIAQFGPEMAKAATGPYKAWAETQNAWVATVKADPEIGGDNFTRMTSTIAKVLDDPRFADPGTREALNLTGAGNNPALIRTLYRMAQALTEGEHVAGNPPRQTKSTAELLYPTHPNGGR
jgi:hypothetical protein